MLYSSQRSSSEKPSLSKRSHARKPDCRTTPDMHTRVQRMLDIMRSHTKYSATYSHTQLAPKLSASLRDELQGYAALSAQAHSMQVHKTLLPHDLHHLTLSFSGRAAPLLPLGYYGIGDLSPSLLSRDLHYDGVPVGLELQQQG